MKTRQGLQDLLADAKKGHFKTLYVTDLSRLSRHLQHTIELLKQLKAHNVALHILSKRTDKGYPEVQFLLQMASIHEEVA